MPFEQFKQDVDAFLSGQSGVELAVGPFRFSERLEMANSALHTGILLPQRTLLRYLPPGGVDWCARRSAPLLISPVDVATNPEETIDAYIGTFPEDVQKVLQAMRQAIRQAVPERATEAVRYNLATFRLDGEDLVYFAGWKKHVSLYPVTEEMRQSMRELAAYKTSGVTVQFPLDKPLPTALISEIVKQRLKGIGLKDGE